MLSALSAIQTGRNPRLYEERAMNRPTTNGFLFLCLAPLTRGVGGFVECLPPPTASYLKEGWLVVAQFIGRSSLFVRIADNTDGTDNADRFLIVSGAFEKKDASLEGRTGNELPYYERVFS